MGFGPSLPDSDQAIRAVREVVELVYPQWATAETLAAVERIAAALLEAKAPLSFEKMDRFLRDPDWREIILERAPKAAPAWASERGRAILPRSLDPALEQLLQDRLKAASEWDLPPSEPEDSGND